LSKTDAEKVKELVVAQAYLNPLFHQQFAQQPIDAVLNTAKTEHLTIGREEAETIAKDARTVIAPFIGVEAKNLVQDITNKITQGFNSILNMSQILFYVGLAIIFIAFLLDIYGVLRGVNWQQYIASSGVLGAIGLGSIYTSFVKGSFEKVRNSVGDLVQINVIFFAYADQLSLLMRESQDEDADILEIIEQIGKVEVQTIKNIQNYCETPSSSTQ
jgi:hypothetical protein